MNEKDKIYLENYRKHLEQYNLSDDEILELADNEELPNLD